MRAGRVARAALIAGALAAARPAAAAVRLELTGSATAVAMELLARNAGDGPADGVTPEVSYQHQTLRGGPVTLAPGASHAWRLDLPPARGPGTFAAIARVRYDDAGTTASVPLVVLVSVPTAPPPAVRTTLTTASGPGFLTARLQVTNVSHRPLAARVAIVLPSVLATEPESVPVQVAPGAERVLPIAVTSRGARAGTRYPLYTVLEYDDDGAHHTVVTRLEAEGGSAAPSRAVPLTIGSIATVTALALLAVAWRAAARRRPA